eukprot:362060_1
MEVKDGVSGPSVDGSGLYGWKLYFPEDEDSPNDPKIPTIRAIIAWFSEDRQKNEYLRPQVEQLSQYNRLTLDLKRMEFDSFPVKDFLSFLWDQPSVLLPCLGIAVHQVLLADRVPYEISKIHVRITRFEPLTPLRQIKANFVEKFVSIRGNVIRTSSVRPLITGMTFSCPQCGNQEFRHFRDGRYDPPDVCSSGDGGGARGGGSRCKGRPVPEKKTATTIDWQKIRVQELMGSDEDDAGRIPRNIECHLSFDLVDSVIPGDLVTVSGVVKAEKTEVQGGGGGARNKNQALFVLSLDVNSIENNAGTDGKLSSMQFSESDLHFIREVHGHENVFRLLVHSLCPTIFGHEIVKAGLLLTLFGGCTKNVNNSKDSIPIRGDSHILIVGDPGLGKSQMLSAVSRVAPRGVYVCGNTSSSTGLTVTLVKESGSGDFALEAGALVLGDQGCCCIDEFDKMNKQHDAMLEAMEQQSISIAKAGIVCSLSARTSVIAAANPVGGHYNRAKTVNENLKISAPLLSRFDLIFILLDSPDELRDAMLSRHVVALHSGKASKIEPNPFESQRSEWHNKLEKERVLGHAVSGWENERPLNERLKMTPEEASGFNPLPRALMRKYIAYARRYVKPKLSGAAKSILQAFYLNLRAQHQSADSTPITTRQLESMIRLAEARAKLELREEVTAEDANDVVEVMKESMYDTFSDEFGSVDFRRAKGLSKAKQKKAFMKHLHRIAQLRQNAVFTTKELLTALEEMHLQLDNPHDFIETLNVQNQLLKMRGNRWRVQSYSQV